MIRKDSKRMLRLFILGALLMLAATGCAPDVFGVFVGMDKPGTTDDGLDYDTNDIIFFNLVDGPDAWEMLFDGEWFGLTDEDHDLSAFSFNELILSFFTTGGITANDALDMEVYLSFEQNRAKIPGIDGRVYGQDIVKLTATDVFNGDATVNTPVDYEYELFFDGSDVDLTTLSEKVDGISVWPPEYYDLLPLDVELPFDCNAGVIFLSTRGPYRVSTNIDGGHLVGDGSDVLAFCAVNTGPDTAGFWFRAFDGSEADLEPRNVGYSLDVFAVGEDIVTSDDAGEIDLDIFFFFTPRKPFTAFDGSVSGGLSDLFLGGAIDNSDGVLGPLGNFNDGSELPAVNGVVESIGMFDFPFSISTP